MIAIRLRFLNLIESLFHSMVGIRRNLNLLDSSTHIIITARAINLVPFDENLIDIDDTLRDFQTNSERCQDFLYH